MSAYTVLFVFSSHKCQDPNKESVHSACPRRAPPDADPSLRSISSQHLSLGYQIGKARRNKSLSSSRPFSAPKDAKGVTTK